MLLWERLAVQGGVKRSTADLLIQVFFFWLSGENFGIHFGWIFGQIRPQIHLECLTLLSCLNWNAAVMRGSKVLQQALKRIPHYRSGKGGEALAEIDVVISSSVADMDQWLEDNVLGAHSPPSSRIGGKIVLGFDIEWRPNRNKGKNNKAALVQLATTNSVLLYQFGNFTSIPISLCNVIKSDSVLKTGVGVLEDLKKLEIDYGILIDNSAYHDIGMAARQFDVFGNDIMNDDEGDEGTTLDETKEVEEDKLSNKKYGLGSLVEEFFGMNVSKPRKIQMSNWENSTLTDDQIMYASYDALMSIDCYKHLYDQGAFEENRKEAMLKNAVASLAIGDRIEVSCRNTMRILYLCMMESSEYLDRTGEYVRKGNENYLQHLLNSELDSDLIDSSLPLLSWNKVRCCIELWAISLCHGYHIFHRVVVHWRALVFFYRILQYHCIILIFTITTTQ